MSNNNVLRSWQTLKVKFKSVIKQLFGLPQTLKLVWAAAPNLTLVWFILLTIQGLLPAATVYLSKVLVDSLIEAKKTGVSQESIQLLLLPATMTVGVLLLTQVLTSILNWIRTVQSELVQDYISGLIHSKAIAVDYAFYESSDYHDHLERARSDASTRSLSLLENSGNLLQNSITFFAMATVIIPYGLWLPIALLLSTLPAFYVVVSTNRQYYSWWHQTTIHRRRTQYFDSMLTHSGVAAELRLFDLGDYFQSAYQKLRQRLVSERLKLFKKQTLARLAAGACGLLVSGAAIAWMGWRALQGQVTLGDLALFYQAFNRGQTLVRDLLGNVGQVYTNSLFLGSLFEFLKLKLHNSETAKLLPLSVPIKKGICLRQVSFGYPGSKRAVLENFDLTIPAGKITAIVGDNGAGKSTLVKLLCRLYDPDSGSVELDGTDIRKLDVNEFRRNLSVLFQFPVNYYETAAQCISFGDLSASRREIETAAKGAGTHEILARLPQGYDTILGKWFDEGVNLSGGELQRVALARAFLRTKAQFIILDEPTSAMDPWAEHDWLSRFRTMANGRTAVVITHRFTLAMRADIIHVMRDGKIIESGNHDQLLAQDGFYAQSWNAQMQVSSSKSVESGIV